MIDKDTVWDRAENAESALSKNGEGGKGKLPMSLALAPEHAVAYVRFAIFYQSQGMFDEIIPVLEKGLAVAPGDEVLLMMRKDAENFRTNETTRTQTSARA